MNFQYYTVDQIARLLDMHPKTIQRYIREGKLKAAKVGKSWRVAGHDLSVFTEGTGNPHQKAQNPNEKKLLSEDRAKVSAVIDIDVHDMEEAMRIVNMLTAVLNVKPPEYGRSSMTAQYLETEYKVRIMLWGSIPFMENILHSVAALTGEAADG